MPKSVLLGVDLGTSSCKVTALNTDTETISHASEPYDVRYPRENWAEQNPEVWYKKCQQTISQVVEKLGSEAVVEAIGVTGQMIGAVVVDEKGQPVRPAILWMDQRSAPQAEKLKDRIGENISQITKTPINTAYTLPKLLWIKEEEPDTWKQIYRILLPKDYIRFKLTGVFATDITDASGTLLFDSEECRWSDQIISETGIDYDYLPEVFSSHEVIGQTTMSATKELGLEKRVPVVAGAGDLFSENMAAGNVSAKHRLIRFGSCGSISAPLSEPRMDPEGHNPCYIHCTPNTWLLETSTQAFGLAYDWYVNNIFNRNNLRGKNTARESLRSQAETVVKDVQPGADGVMFVPFTHGAPYWNPNLGGTFLGLSPTHDHKHLVRAVLEGISFSLEDALQQLEETGGFGKRSKYSWRCIGGGTNSPSWTNTVANVLGVDLHLVSEAGPAKGAALLAGIGAGLFADFSEVIELTTSSTEKICHSTDRHDTYQKVYRKYSRTVSKLEELYKTCEWRQE